MSRRQAKPPRMCDAPGCTVEVRRGFLMCRPHWFQLPKPLRDAINENWRAKRIKDWSANCLEARGFIVRAQTETAARAERCRAGVARILGEREDEA